MAARKSRPVLYELIAQAQQRTWTRPALPPQSTKPPAAASQPGSDAPRAGASRAEGLSALATWVGRRVGAGLSVPYLAAIAVAAVGLIALAYYAGRSSSDDNAASAALEQSLTQKPTAAAPVDDRPRAEPTLTHRPTRPVAIPPRPDQPSPEPAPDERPVAPAPPPPANTAKPEEPARPHAFESGRSYVIVQHLSKRGPGPQAAERIRDFLTAGGVACTVHSSGADLMVVATEPFAIDAKKKKDSSDPERKRAQQLMDRIRKLGEQYVTNGYTFKDCYLREF